MTSIEANKTVAPTCIEAGVEKTIRSSAAHFPLSDLASSRCHWTSAALGYRAAAARAIRGAKEIGLTGRKQIT